VRFDQDFLEVAKACQEGRNDWNWLTDDLIDVYRKLNERGLMAAVGTYRDGRLVGGLFGPAIGRTFSIVSIFHRENHAGSVAMAALADVLSADGRWSLIDFGNMTSHNERFGAVLVPEERFLELLQKN
jgi:leucyl/phenylalanyl-tRNA---protein transferase